MKDFTQGMSGFGANFFGWLTHTTDLLTEGVGKLAEQAGVLLSHLWIVFTRQQLILGLQEFLTGLAMLIASIFTYKALVKYNKEKKMAQLDKYALQLVFLVATIWLVVAGLQDTIASLPRLINPEYYALQESIKLLKEIKP